MDILIGFAEPTFTNGFKHKIQFPNMGFTSNVSDRWRGHWAASKSLFGFFNQSFFARRLCRVLKANLRTQYLHKSWLWRITLRSLNEINREFTARYAEKHRPNRTAKTLSIFALGGLTCSLMRGKSWFDSNLSNQIKLRPRHTVGLSRWTLLKIKSCPDKSQSTTKQLVVFILLSRLLSTGA